MTAHIRAAGWADMEAIYGLLTAMHAENALAPLHEPKVRGKIGDVLSKGVALIAESGGIAVATMGLERQAWWYSTGEFLVNPWIYIHPDFRASTLARRLLDTASAVAAENDVPLVIDIASPVEPERKAALFRRRGMRPIGGLFIEGK